MYLDSASELNLMSEAPSPWPFRASFNFTARCNLSCEFCYIPFSNHAVDLAQAKRVVTKLAELGVQSVTFGGGDPLRYKFVAELLAHARKVGITHLQIDTNVLGWASKELLGEVADIVDLVGLPLDGPNPNAHAAMRASRRSWTDSVSAAVYLKGRTGVKINTVVGAPNINSIKDLGVLIGLLSPAIWTLYEFWTIGPVAHENEQRFALRPGDFADAIGVIQMLLANEGTVIENGTVSSRSSSYFLVTDTGLAYTVDRLDSAKYIELGSIFDRDVIRRWISTADAELNYHRTARRIGWAHGSAHQRAGRPNGP